jgi:hypothetical protein
MTGAHLVDGERKELRASFGIDDDRPIVLHAAKF